MTRMGLVVNPVAGMGGRVGLHGTDGADALLGARARGGTPVSEARAARALGRLRGMADDIVIVAAPGSLGAGACQRAGVAFETLAVPSPVEPTTAADTVRSVTGILAAGVHLLLFAGGDGTARDVLGVVGAATPILGVPSGVKMRSGVFALSPEAAGDVARDFLHGDRGTREAEVVDAAEREGSGGESTRFFGTVLVPAGDARVQNVKGSSSVGGDAEIDALCREIAAGLRPDTVYLFGPGLTTKRILAAIGHSGTALGVDATRGRQIVGHDLSEAEILALVPPGQAAVLFLGVIGGQGFLLGRGNQQLSGAVLSKVGEDNIVILSAESKLASLAPAILWVDVGDECAEPVLSDGYRRILTGPGRSMVMRTARTAASGERDLGHAI